MYLGARRRSRDWPSRRRGVSDRAFPSHERAAAGPDEPGQHRVDCDVHLADLHRRALDRKPLAAAPRRAMTLRTVSVVIITRNEGRELARTVRNVRRTLPAAR